MFNLSRYWNRFIYSIIFTCKKLIWDYTGKNKDILGDYFAEETTREIMTYINEDKQ